MDAPCRIELFGELKVRQKHRVFTRFPTRKTAMLLAYLAYHLHQTHPRELLIEMLWPDALPEVGRNRLSVALSSLRRQLEPPGVLAGTIIQATYADVRLNPTAVTTDVVDFETALRAAIGASNDTEKKRFLSEVVALYTGTLLQGFYEDWLLIEQEHCAERFFLAVEQLLPLLQQAGERARALEYARRAVALDPLREEAHLAVIHLLNALGQPAAARRQYEEMERILQQELGAPPSATRRQLVREMENTATLVGAFPQVKNREAGTSEAQTSPLPSGTVTFLLLDVADANLFPPQDVRTLERFQELIRSTVAQRGGRVINTLGSAVTAVFARASDALDGAVTCQCMFKHNLPGLRIALHTGEMNPENRHLYEAAIELTTQLRAASHDGQILCSAETAYLLRRSLESELRLLDMGLYRLTERSAPERLFAIAYPGMPEEKIARPRALSIYTGCLPVSLTRFFGREEEIAWLEAKLLSNKTRLLTLTGPGGSGKTRLAIEVSRRLAGPRQGAVWFVPLTDLMDAGLIAGAVLDVMGLSRNATAEPQEQIIEALSHQPSLLLLDNFEHLVEDGAVVVRDLLERIPTLTCLITSRRYLQIEGEQEYVVRPLPTPNITDPPERLIRSVCVQLFLDRAQAVRPDFQVTQTNAMALARLCVRLEGIPLALVLAASRMRVMTPAQMLSEMAQRWDFLTSRKQGVVRHQTLRAAIDWSYRLLPEALQSFFARLSIFRGGWTVEAAEAVCQEPEAQEYLEQLREWSLVTVEENAFGPRFRMLETLREYAAEQLSPEEYVAECQRHLEYYGELIEACRLENLPDIDTHKLERLQSEHENLRIALAFCVREEASPYLESGFRLAPLLCEYWERSGYLQEGQQYLARLLALADPNRQTPMHTWAVYCAAVMALRRHDYENAQALFEEAVTLYRNLDDLRGLGRALNGQGYVAAGRGDYRAARASFEESLKLFRDDSDRHGLAGTMGTLGWIAMEQGDYTRAEAFLQEALALQKEVGDPSVMADSLYCLGLVATAQSNHARACSLLTEGLAINRALGDKYRASVTLHSLADVVCRQGDLIQATTLYEESLALSRETGNRLFEAVNLHDMGLIAATREDTAQARTLYAESLTIKRELGDGLALTQTLEAVAALAAANRQCQAAAGLFGAAAMQREQMGTPVLLVEREAHMRRVAAVRAALGEEAFASAWSEGSALTLEQAVESASRLL